MAQRVCSDDVESLAKELGFKFGLLNSTRLLQNFDADTCDPDTVFLMDIGRPVPDGDRGYYDAKICWKGRQQLITWNESTRASLRKLLENDGSSNTCAVCLEALGIRESLNCAGCNSMMCTTCVFKMSLTDAAVVGVNHHQWLVGCRCPECRRDMSFDIRTMYFRVFDRLNLFSDSQRAALQLAKEYDPNCAEQMKTWKEKHPLRQYGQGIVVKVYGLKTQKKWNGKKATIIGEGVVKSGVFRWPIELQIKGKPRALLKQTNLKVVSK